MRSLFWRILAIFWLAIALTAGLSLLVGRALTQDTWILHQYPPLHDVDQQWVQLYEHQGPVAAQAFLELKRRRDHISIQVFNESDQELVKGTFSPRGAEFETRHRGEPHELPWRVLTSSYLSPESGNTYQFIYRVRHGDLSAWLRSESVFPLSAIAISLVVVTLFSLLLTLSITRPLGRLRGAVHDLGQTSYQQNSLAHLARRKDELGVLARDFNRMGAKLQNLISSQRQLLRDVSHELRSPLARLRIALALAERASAEEREKLWPKLAQECDRLEALIGEILALARLDADLGEAVDIDLPALLDTFKDDAALHVPPQHLKITLPPTVQLCSWPQMLQRILDNLLRNAQRFNPPEQPIEINVSCQDEHYRISVRDHGPGVDEEDLPHLGEPFYRANGQGANGHGLGLTIALRAAEKMGATLQFANHPQGGFMATLSIPGTPPK